MNRFISLLYGSTVHFDRRPEQMHAERHISHIVRVGIVRRSRMKFAERLIEHTVGDPCEHAAQRHLIYLAAAVKQIITAAVYILKCIPRINAFDPVGKYIDRRREKPARYTDRLGGADISFLIISDMYDLTGTDAERLQCLKIQFSAMF